MKKCAAILLFLLFAFAVDAQVISYQWRTEPGHANVVYLYARDVSGRLDQVGGYNTKTDVFRPLLDYHAGIWGDPCEPPCILPAEFASHHKKRPSATANFGVYMDKEPKIGDEDKGDRYTLNTLWGTRDVTKDQARRLVSEGLPDDRSKWRLTIIGKDDDRARVIKDLEGKEFEALRSAVNLWSVPPTHWSLFSNTTGKPMFVVTGKPTIYLQGPLGSDKPVHRQDDYAGATDLKAIQDFVSSKKTETPANNVENTEVAGVVRDNEGKYDSEQDPDVRTKSVDLLSLILLILGGSGWGGLTGLRFLKFI